MFGVERRQKIMTLLFDKRSILVQDTAALFEVTEETIRRDLKVLEKQGLLTRTHGGAVLLDNTQSEAPLEIREGINIKGKNLIGREAAKLINDGDTILLDASTSSLYVAKHLKAKQGLTVITNAERIVLELALCDEITIICTGGILRSKSLSYTGRVAEKAIGNYHADKVFFSCKGFSPKRGMTDSNEAESDIRKLMIRSSEKSVFLCDNTKFDKVGYVNTARLDEIDYFYTDTPIPAEWQCEFDDHQVQLVTVIE